MHWNSRVRSRLLQAARVSGVLGLWRHLMRHRVAILSAHGVMEANESTTWEPLRPRLSPTRLAEYLAMLSRHYRFVSLSDALEMLSGHRPVEPHSLVMTFDDGYRNNLTRALPVLRRFRAPAAFFIPTGKVEERSLFAFDRLDFALQRIPAERIQLVVNGTSTTVALESRAGLADSFRKLRRQLKRSLGADLEYGESVMHLVRTCEGRAGSSLESMKESDEWSALLSWDEVAALAEDPLIEIGSHTVDHTRVGLADDATVRYQMRRSKEQLEARTRRSCSRLAYPNGDFSPKVAAIAREEGYSCGLSTQEGLCRPGDDPMALRRIGLPPDADSTELLARVSGFSEALSQARSRF